MLHERTDPHSPRSFKRIVQLAVVGLALAGLTACGGGNGEPPPGGEPPPACPQGQVRGDDGQCMPEMPGEGGGGEIPITRATKSCLFPVSGGSGLGGLCLGPVDLNCSETSSQVNPILIGLVGAQAQLSPPSELQQCPTSGSEYRTIVECRPPAPAASMFHYWTEARGAQYIEADRTGCESVGASSFHIHKQQQQQPQPEPEPEPTGNMFTFTATDACNDGRPVEYRLFEQIGDVTPSSRRHPGGNQFFVTRDLGQAGTTRIPCQAGTNICYGGQIQGTSSHFGVGMDGSRGCTGCCRSCGSTRMERFGCPQQQPQPEPTTQTQYSALYWGRVEVSRNNWSYSWAFGSGTSASAAESDAKRQCESGFRGNCERKIPGYANACGAIAVSECPEGCGSPAFGYGADRLRREAEDEAVRVCERGATTALTRGTCRVATGRERHSRQLTTGVQCVGTAAQ